MKSSCFCVVLVRKRWEAGGKSGKRRGLEWRWCELLKQHWQLVLLVHHVTPPTHMHTEVGNHAHVQGECSCETICEETRMAKPLLVLPSEVHTQACLRLTWDCALHGCQLCAFVNLTIEDVSLCSQALRKWGREGALAPL